jgi:hypothetical protein
MGEQESPWNVRFYCWGCGDDFTDTIMINILKEAEKKGCEDPLAVANNLLQVGAIFKPDGEKREPNEKEILFMAEIGILLLACQSKAGPETLCDKCMSNRLKDAKKRAFKVLSSKSITP